MRADPLVVSRLRMLWWVAGVVLVAATVYLTLEPASSIPSPGNFDKVEHFATYVALMLWFSGLVSRRRHWLVAAALVLLGGCLELLQVSMQLGRSGEWLDFAANAAGVGVGWFIAATFGDAWARRLEAWVGR